MPITADQFAVVANLLRSRSGINLERGKEYLVENRLQPVAKANGLGDVTGLISRLALAPPPSLIDAVIDAMTTNESSWFRDTHPYDALREHILPDLIARRETTRALRIWCAACSTGQEPYSLAMLLVDRPELAGWTVRIHATDLSPTALAQARAGRFSQLEVGRGLPAPMLVRHFQRRGAGWEIAPALRTMIDFAPLNLIAPFSVPGPFDLVMLRNVLIYFDVPTKTRVLEQVGRMMRPDGYLMLGSSETTIGTTTRFVSNPVGRTIAYRPDVSLASSPATPGVARPAPAPPAAGRTVPLAGTARPAVPTRPALAGTARSAVPARSAVRTAISRPLA